MREPSKTTVKQIASLLMEIHRIPDDKSLVPLFGAGHESTNLDAIAHWVNSHLDEIGNEENTLLRLQHVASNQNSGGSEHGGNHANM